MDSQPFAREPAGRSGRRWPALAGFGVVVIGLFIAARLLPVGAWIDRLERWVEGLGAWGPLAYGGVYVLAVVLLIPGSLITLAAGALFGLFWGMVTVSIASTLAAGVAFLIARYVARSKVEAMAARSTKFAAIDKAVGERGWLIIGLLRLSPAVPYTLSNYFYGLTSVRFVPYMLASWIGMLPGTFMYVYIGYVGREGLSGAGGASERTTGEWVLLGVGLAATIAVTIYVTRVAYNAVKRETALGDSREESTSSSS